MKFYTFMVRNHIDDTGPIGKLARDMKEDKEHFPMNGVMKFDGWHRIMRDYLEGCGAEDKYQDAFEEAWKEYEQCERKRLKLKL